MNRQNVGAAVLVAAILCLAFFIRIQGIPTVPPGQFIETDAYLYYWQAQLVAEHGKLPARDMHRWVPLGRDNGQTLNLYGYVLAYGHKTIGFIFPKVSLYHVCLYAPAVCFCIGIGALCLFLFGTHGLLFSSIVGILLATLPGTIDRSTAGFGDRDSWCLMLGILTITTYLVSLQTQHRQRQHLWTLTSGVLMFLGGLSWEGFGVFLSIILFMELWRFLTVETEEGLGMFLLWTFTFVPTLWLASPAYRSGQGFATHLFAFMLMPPLVLLGIRYLQHLLITKTQKCRTHARSLALGLTLVSVTLALGYVLIHRNTFADTIVPFSQNELMKDVAELDETFLIHWMKLFLSIGCSATAACLYWAVSVSSWLSSAFGKYRACCSLHHSLFSQ